MISWVSERKAIFVDSFVPGGCCKCECTEWRMVCSVPNTVGPWKCREVTSACIDWEGAVRELGWEARAGQRGDWHRWSLQVSEGVRYYSEYIFLYSTVNHAFLRGAMRRSSIRFTHSLVRAHREGY